MVYTKDHLIMDKKVGKRNNIVLILLASSCSSSKMLIIVIIVLFVVGCNSFNGSMYDDKFKNDTTS